ncbi:MAG: O-antigen ligase family protein [Actinomycetota bacterium]|nr:O-antigen ligase family protein [Actinomycetota bacterium]
MNPKALTQEKKTKAVGHTAVTNGWVVAGAVALVGVALVLRLLGAGVPALWFLVAGALAAPWGLRAPLAATSPLFTGALGWLVDMLPLVTLAGWTGFTASWLWTLWKEKRTPRLDAGAWIAIALLGWTIVGVTAVQSANLKHFALLVGIQLLISLTVVAVSDICREIHYARSMSAALLFFVTLLSIVVLFEWLGAPVQELQESETRERVEAAYGLDSFPSDRGMIKYARVKNAGAGRLQRQLAAMQQRTPGLPSSDVFAAGLDSYGENKLLVRFAGSARPYERDLQDLDIDLRFDSIGIAPADTVPRLRSLPRNALTYPGMCAALFPLSFMFVAAGRRRTKVFGVVCAAACLFGAGFALARGAWIVIVLAGAYLIVDGRLPIKFKISYFAAVAAGAIVVAAVFWFAYGSDPLTARAGGDASIVTRQDLYKDTVSSSQGRYALTGHGTTKPRETEDDKVTGRYIPLAGTHSTYLNYLYRTGIPGAALLAGLYALGFFRARQRAVGSRGADGTFFSLVTASALAFAAHGVILNLYVEPYYTLTISLLLGMALAARATGTEEDRTV